MRPLYQVAARCRDLQLTLWFEDILHALKCKEKIEELSDLEAQVTRYMILTEFPSDLDEVLQQLLDEVRDPSEEVRKLFEENDMDREEIGELYSDGYEEEEEENGGDDEDEPEREGRIISLRGTAGPIKKEKKKEEKDQGTEEKVKARLSTKEDN